MKRNTCFATLNKLEACDFTVCVQFRDKAVVISCLRLSIDVGDKIRFSFRIGDETMGGFQPSDLSGTAG
jgi:hypothetical protein